MNKRGFLLMEALVVVYLLAFISVLCFYTFRTLDVFYQNFQEYKQQDNANFAYFFSSVGECEKCQIEEEPSV